MNTMLRKVVAGAGVTAVLAMQFASFVSAAGLDGDYLDVVGLPTSTSITITTNDLSTPFAGGNAVCTATISPSLGDVTCSETASGELTITTTTPIAADTAYSISFVGSGENPAYGAVVLQNGTANTVQVSARVAPILTLALADGSDGNQLIALGTLTPGTFAKDDIGLTYSTNAVNGLTVSMRSTGLKDVGIDREIGVNDIDTTGNAVQTAATDYYRFAAGTGVTFATATDMNINQIAVNTITVQPSITSYITVGAQVEATTEAGSYSDILTFSATGRF